jgi:hypothetical protein
MLDWSKLEIEFVIKNAPFVDDEEGCRQFCMIFDKNITVHTWRRLRVKLGIQKGTTKNGKVTIIPGSPLDKAGVKAEDLLKVII